MQRRRDLLGHGLVLDVHALFVSAELRGTDTPAAAAPPACARSSALLPSTARLIRHRRATQVWGGAVYVNWGASLTCIACSLEDNHAVITQPTLPTRQLGIPLSRLDTKWPHAQCSPWRRLRACVGSDDDDAQKQGGAVFVRGAYGVPKPIWSRATLVDTQLVNNRALAGSTNIDGRGGGVYVSYRGNLTTYRTTFYKNDAVRSSLPYPRPTHSCARSATLVSSHSQSAAQFGARFADVARWNSPVVFLHHHSICRSASESSRPIVRTCCLSTVRRQCGCGTGGAW
jgi:hypothetical protein